MAVAVNAALLLLLRVAFAAALVLFIVMLINLLRREATENR